MTEFRKLDGKIRSIFIIFQIMETFAFVFIFRNDFSSPVIFIVPHFNAGSENIIGNRIPKEDRIACHVHLSDHKIQRIHLIFRYFRAVEFKTPNECRYTPSRNTDPCSFGIDQIIVEFLIIRHFGIFLLHLFHIIFKEQFPQFLHPAFIVVIITVENVTQNPRR